MSAVPPFDSMHTEHCSTLFDVFGRDGTIQRGNSAAVAVRVVVDVGVEQLGEYGQVVARVTTVSFLSAQFRPRQGDVLTLPEWTKPVSSVETDDGFVVKAVMHG
jgi:hypothetical protein